MSLTYKRTKRRYPRNKTEHNKVCEISFSKTATEFVVDATGLVCNEGYKGCCVTILNNDKFTIGAKILIRIDDHYPIHAEVRWVNVVDKDISKCGIEYLIEEME